MNKNHSITQVAKDLSERIEVLLNENRDQLTVTDKTTLQEVLELLDQLQEARPPDLLTIDRVLKGAEIVAKLMDLFGLVDLIGLSS